MAIIPSFNKSNRLQLETLIFCCKITFNRSVWLFVQMTVRKFHIASVFTYWILPLVNCSTLYHVCRYGFSNENCDTPKLVTCGIRVGQQLAHPWRQELCSLSACSLGPLFLFLRNNYNSMSNKHRRLVHDLF